MDCEATSIQSAGMERALARGVVARKELEREEGGSHSGEQVAELLKITPQTVERRRKARGMIAWQNESRNWRFPVWQFGVQGIKDCLNALNTDSGFGAMIFFLSPRYSLVGKRPLDLLREGKVKEALLVARRHETHGAW